MSVFNLGNSGMQEPWQIFPLSQQTSEVSEKIKPYTPAVSSEETELSNRSFSPYIRNLLIWNSRTLLFSRVPTYLVPSAHPNPPRSAGGQGKASHTSWSSHACSGRDPTQRSNTEEHTEGQQEQDKRRQWLIHLLTDHHGMSCVPGHGPSAVQGNLNLTSLLPLK